MSDPQRVIALMAAYNEEDVIAAAVEALISEGVAVYLLDDGSTDGTVEACRPFLGRGLLAIEALDETRPQATKVYSQERLCLRKAELAHELEAAWFLNVDADEFREAPLPGLSLLEGIRAVDALGYNAIDFAVLNFRPTDDGHRPGTDPRPAFTHYELGGEYDLAQVKCWKKQAAPVDLASSAGHEARFPDRRVYPVRFLLRHYPIRGQAHGERKVLRERQARFDPGEVARGWHVQYAGFGPGSRFRWDPATLERWDPVRSRMALLRSNREADEASLRLQDFNRARAELARLKSDLSWLVEKQREEAASARRAEATRRELVEALRQRDEAVRWLEQRRADEEQLRAAADRARDELTAVVGARDEALRWLEQKRAEERARVTTAEAALGARDEALRWLEQQRAEEQGRAAAAETSLSALVAARDEAIAWLTEKRDERARADEATQRALDERTREAATASARVAELEAALREQQARLAATAAELEQLRSSKSWRYTAPLRHALARLAPDDED